YAWLRSEELLMVSIVGASRPEAKRPANRGVGRFPYRVGRAPGLADQTAGPASEVVSGVSPVPVGGSGIAFVAGLVGTRSGGTGSIDGSGGTRSVHPNRVMTSLVLRTKAL